MKPDVVNPSEPRALHRLAVAVRTSGSGLSQDWPSSSDGTRAVCISVRPPQLYEGTCRLRELREPVLWRGRSGQSAIEIQNALHIILRPAERHTDGACHGKPKPSLPRARIPGPSPLPHLPLLSQRRLEDLVPPSTCAEMLGLLTFRAGCAVPEHSSGASKEQSLHLGLWMSMAA